LSAKKSEIPHHAASATIRIHLPQTNMAHIDFDQLDLPQPKLRRSPRAVELPFTVKIVRTEDQLAQAVRLREAAYSRHYPADPKRRLVDERADKSSQSLVLIAERKGDGELLGTIRVETGTLEPHPVEELLPDELRFAESTIAYLTRLAIVQGAESQLVKAALIKALHRYCFAVQIDWLIVVAVPPMDRQYLRIGFEDVHPDGALKPLPWNKKIYARVLAMDVTAAERNAKTRNHPLYDFLFRSFCPDIQIFGSLTGVWSRPRLRRVAPPSQEVLDAALGLPIV